jgi:hypothetical protein
MYVTRSIAVLCTVSCVLMRHGLSHNNRRIPFIHPVCDTSMTEAYAAVIPTYLCHFNSSHLSAPSPHPSPITPPSYRDAKLNEILRHEHRLSEIFKYVDDKEDLLQLDRKTKEDLQVPHTSLLR